MLRPQEANVIVGTSIQMQAIALVSDGTTADVTAASVWTSSDLTVASVSRGLIGGRGAGTATVSARYLTVTASAQVTVVAAELASITVTPGYPTVSSGAPIQFAAMGTFTNGAQQDLTALALWSTAPPGIASFSSDGGTPGLADGVSPGTATVSAEYEGIYGSALLTVRPPDQVQVYPGPSWVALGSTVYFNADFDSSFVTPGASWSSSDPNVATVTYESGPPGIPALGVGLGTAKILATYAGVQGESALTVVQTLADSQNSPLAIAVDGTSVYWTSVGNGTVNRVSLDGGAIQVLASSQQGPCALAVDATSVYWINTGEGTVSAAALTGGPRAVLATGQQFASCLSADRPGIAVDSTSVYWTNLNGGGAVTKVLLDGGGTVDLSSGQNNPAGLAIDSTSVYWVNWGSGSVMKVGLDGGTPVLLANLPGSSPASLAVDATSVYWTHKENPDGFVAKVALDGGPVTMLATSQPLPSDIAVDANFVYWTNEAAGTIVKVPLDGGVLVTVLPQNLNVIPWGIAIDSKYAYWTEEYSNTVFKGLK